MFINMLSLFCFALLFFVFNVLQMPCYLYDEKNRKRDLSHLMDKKFELPTRDDQGTLSFQICQTVASPGTEIHEYNGI